MSIKKMNLPLPASLHEAIVSEARRQRIPATRLVRSVLKRWLAERRRAQRAEEIRRFAEAHAGSELDLDEELEAATLEVVSEDGPSETG
jgi:hypothetical protein